MTSRWLTLLLLLVPTVGWAQVTTQLATGAAPSAAAPCSQSCSTQTFTTDPNIGQQWSLYSDFPWCRPSWDSSGGTLQRTFTSSLANPVCDNSTAFARYNGQIARDMCVKYQVVSSNNGSGDHDLGFEPGFVLRHQTDPIISADNFDPNFGAWVLRCETGLNCATMRLSRVQTLSTVALDCTTFGAVAEGGWIGACIRGTNTGTVVNAFNLGASDPGVPADSDGTGSWQTAAAVGAVAPVTHMCTFDAAFAAPSSVCAAGVGFCDDSGTSAGIWLRTNTVSTGAVYKVDNFSTYSCQ